ncbi:MAG: phenylalanine--tRNA ligase subunit alpha [Chloroflexi bacterium]|nr:phenylalanine--tRNA ligase subunit alpha [Chloroflexota bacterium]
MSTPTLDYDPQTALAELRGLASLNELEDWRVAHLGRRSGIMTALSGLGQAPADQRREIGQRLNTAKQALERALEERKDELTRSQLGEQLERERIDPTLPGRVPPRGLSHPLVTVTQQICELFRRIGFQIVEGPEVEWEHYNFTMLRLTEDHPARDETDTYWVTDKMLLRTHTSPVQIRALEYVKQPPIRVLVPGRVYRPEAVDASHESNFHQIEGLLVDDRTTMSDMMGMLTYMARGVFGQERKARFGCDQGFPFVEPGAQMSIDCAVCRGEGCRVCRYSGWLEVLGCGMVHPGVLRGLNIDPAKYTGWAFGVGVERIAMMKYGVDDIRLFQGNDLRFLRQVG